MTEKHCQQQIRGVFHVIRYEAPKASTDVKHRIHNVVSVPQYEDCLYVHISYQLHWRSHMWQQSEHIARSIVTVLLTYGACNSFRVLFGDLHQLLLGTLPTALRQTVGV